jgi:hypothetical protein
MTYQKAKHCPKCGSDCLSVYKYDSGWQYVECDGPGCWYRGPGAGSIGAALKLHNRDCCTLAVSPAVQTPIENKGGGQS